MRRTKAQLLASTRGQIPIIKDWLANDPKFFKEWYTRQCKTKKWCVDQVLKEIK